MEVRKAVVPAGGLGTRLLPATRTVPKELLPVVDRPMIHYVVEEATASGIRQMVLVLSREKTALMDYFDRLPELERLLEEKGDRRLLEAVRRTAEMVECVFVRQPVPLGLGHAVYTARHAVGDEPFAVLLPDDILLSEVPGLEQVLRVWRRYGGVALGVERVPWEEVSRYGVIRAEEVEPRVFRVQGLVEKPPPHSAPSNLAVVGRYVLPPEVFEVLPQVPPGAKGEVQLTDALERLREWVPAYAVELEGIRYDVGTPLGLLKASVAVALRHPDLGPALRGWLRGLLGEA